MQRNTSMCHFERQKPRNLTELEPFLTQKDPSKKRKREGNRQRAHALTDFQNENRGA